MKLLKYISLVLLFGLALSKPVKDDDDEKITIDDEVYVEQFVLYTGKHDIVDIMFPLNDEFFNDDSSESLSNSKEDEDQVTLFFIEGDIKGKNDFESKGLYALKNKTTYKLLDKGTAMTFDINNDAIYFGAEDGIYKYDVGKIKAKKYGQITDSVKALSKISGTDKFIMLTEDKNVYEVTDNASKKTKLDFNSKPEQMVLGYDQNLYYFGEDKKFYVYNKNGTKEIEGLPENTEYVKIARPPFVAADGIILHINDQVYQAYGNGTSELTDFEVKIRPTAYSMEAALIQFYGHEKKIYSYNLLLIIVAGIFEELGNYLTQLEGSIRTLASSPKLMF